jgi:hypothetical protein
MPIMEKKTARQRNGTGRQKPMYLTQFGGDGRAYISITLECINHRFRR